MSGDLKDASLNPAHQKLLRAMLDTPGNRTCADCRGPSARWASTNLGCFLCIECSGIHRKLGVHITVVRSLTLDTWTPNQIAHFTGLGNAISATIYEEHLPPTFTRPTPADARAMERFIRDKYERKLYTSPANGGLGGRARPSPRPSPRVAPRASPRAERLTHARPRHSPRGGTASSAHVIAAILDMGFPPQAAVRAVDATRGDLHAAVEWVLANEQTLSAPHPRTRTPREAPKPAPAPPPPVDLLSFDDDPPASAPAAAQPRVPAHMGGAPQVARAAPAYMAAAPQVANAVHQAASAAPPAKAAPPPWASDDDFADFGAFESAPVGAPAPAMPTAAPAPLAARPAPASAGAGAAAGLGVGSAALSALYAQIPVQAPAVLGAVPRAGLVKPLGGATGSMGVGVGGLPAMRAPLARTPATGVQTPATGVQQHLRQPVASAMVRGMSSAAATPPPPPPPQGSAIPSTLGSVPPPPPASTPPPLSAAGTPSESHSTPATAAVAATKGDANGKTGVGKVEEEEPAKPEELEDPFAGLAMFALNESRKAPKKPKTTLPHVSLDAGKPKDVATDATQITNNALTGDVNTLVGQLGEPSAEPNGEAAPGIADSLGNMGLSGKPAAVNAESTLESGGLPGSTPAALGKSLDELLGL